MDHGEVRKPRSAKAGSKELKLNGKFSAVVNTKARIAKRRQQSPRYAAPYDEARQEHVIGLELARLRKLTGLRQEDVADRMHTSAQAVGRLEKANYKGHSLSSLSRYAAAIGGTFAVKATKKGFRLEFTAPETKG